MILSPQSVGDQARAFLQSLVGEWEGQSQLFLEPGKLFEQFATRGRFRRMEEGGFWAHEYSESIEGKPHRALAIYAFDDESGQYECAWMHSWHMSKALLISRGKVTSGGFFVHGTYGDGQNGPRWGWRTEHRLEAPDRLVITAFNITPAGEEAKAVETVYSRRK